LARAIGEPRLGGMARLTGAPAFDRG
jgi:hypothetical protein